MKITIITVCLNSEKTITKTIESILSQTYKNYEYIVIDGKSIDRTIQIIKEYQKKFDGRMKWISEKDSGLYYAMNKGIQLANGELIGILNSDDWYEKNTLELVSVEAIKHPETVIYGLEKRFYDDDEYLIHSRSFQSLPKHGIPHPTVFIPKKIYTKYGNFDTNYRIAADYELTLRFYLKGVNYFQIERILANYLIGGISSQFEGVKTKREEISVKYNHQLITKNIAILMVVKEYINYLVVKLGKLIKM